MKLALLGLNKYEEESYKALVKLGKATASKISATSGVPYGRIYDILSSLEEKGLIQVVPEPTKAYIPSSPENLKKLLTKHKKEIHEIEQELEELKQLYEQHEEEVVEIASGKRNFYRLLKKIPKSKEFGYAIKYTSEYHPEWVRSAKNKRKEGKIDSKTLARYDKETEKDVKKWLKINPYIKKINNEGIAFSINDTGVIIGLIKSNTTIVIKDKPFISLMKDLFLSKYKQAKKITP